MYALVSILIVIAAVLLVLIVLVQDSKGGGLASNFSASNQYMGVRKTNDFLEKATWTLSIAILALCIVAAATIGSRTKVERSAIENQVQNAVDPSAIPAFPTEAPAQNGKGNSEEPNN